VYGWVIIGILNYINLMVTGILTRQKELAMLNAIGIPLIFYKSICKKSTVEWLRVE